MKERKKKKKKVSSMIIMLSSSAGVWGGVFVHKVQEQIYSLVLRMFQISKTILLRTIII
jgi:hypothetical protein